VQLLTSNSWHEQQALTGHIMPAVTLLQNSVNRAARCSLHLTQLNFIVTYLQPEAELLNTEAILKVTRNKKK